MKCTIGVGSVGRALRGFAVAAAFWGGGAQAETAYPLYVVDTDEGTLDAPVSVETLPVTQYAAAGAEPVLTDFAAVSASPLGAGTFVKRGSGYVMGSVAFTNFTGEVRVEKGAWVVDRPGMGGSNLSADTAPTFAVSNGAAFVCAATKTSFPSFGTWGHNLVRYTKFVLEGTGPDGCGALLNASTEALNCACWNTTMTLSGDATFGEKSVSTRFDLGTYAVIDLQGHDLLIKNFKSETTYNGIFTPDCTVKNPGSIRVEGTSLLLQGGPAFKGDAASELIFGKGAALQTWNAAMTLARLPWTIRFTDGSRMTPSRGSKTVEFDEADNYFDAPVVIDENRLYAYSSTRGNGVAFNGRVSGVGGFYFSGELSLALNCASNAFAGAVALNGEARYADSSVLRLGADGALPENGPGAALTNAALRLTKSVSYHLPRLDFHTKLARASGYWVEGGTEGTVAGLRKTGAQILEWRTPLSVTGLTEIVEGTFKLSPAVSVDDLYSAVPGLYEWSVADTGTYGREMAYGVWTSNYWSVVSNNVVGAMEALRQTAPWPAFSTYEWHGYVWNRSPTNETWTFARSICGYSRLMIDRKFECGSDDNGNVIRDNYVMTPGPHEILFRVNARSYGGHGSAKNVATWAPDMGLAIDRYGRKSANAADYVFLENGLQSQVEGGDGYWFTRDARARGDFSSEELAACTRKTRFPVVRVHAGSTLDLSMPDAPMAAPLVIDDFAGANVVTNGSLVIAAKWTLLGDEAAGLPLTVTDGSLKFSPGAVLDVEDVESFKRGPAIEIARAKEGVSGQPTLTPALREAGWILYVQGGSLMLRNASATVISLR